MLEYFFRELRKFERDILFHCLEGGIVLVVGGLFTSIMYKHPIHSIIIHQLEVNSVETNNPFAVAGHGKYSIVRKFLLFKQSSYFFSHFRRTVFNMFQPLRAGYLRASSIS
jgi:hypothetical protein